MTPAETGIIIDLIDRALREDLGAAGDITSISLFSPSECAAAEIKSKESGVLSGAYLLEPLFHRLDPALRVTTLLDDGARLNVGSIICRLEGAIRPILAGERTALNLLQRLSGIATRTARLTEFLAGTRARLLDTRKTTPGLRMLEKMAVVHGGGANHRFGLFDMVLIKNTHVKAAGGPAMAVRRAREYLEREKLGLKIEVEVQSEAEFMDALPERPDRIMLDNMPPGTMAACVRHVREPGLPIELEASGNITETTLRAVAETGVDFISSGAITHSVKALDIHLVIV